MQRRDFDRAFVRLAIDRVDEVDATGVAFALTVGNTDAQIKQRYAGAKSPDQMLFTVFPRAPAFLAREADRVASVVSKLRSGHGRDKINSLVLSAQRRA